MGVYKCPVCEGEGKVTKTINIIIKKVVCHGCDGKGWVSTEAPRKRLKPYLNPNTIKEVRD